MQTNAETVIEIKEQGKNFDWYVMWRMYKWTERGV